MNSLGRLHFHVGFAAAALAAIVLLLLAFKTVERYEEIRLDEHIYASASRVVREGLVRRLDDPSLWAVLAGALSGLWLLRAANKLACAVPTLRTSWMDAWSSWLVWIAAFSSGAAVYLLVVYLKDETFWYMIKAGHQVYADTAIPLVQKAEGIANLTAILIATSFFPPALVVLRQLERTLGTLGTTPPSKDLQKAGASLASIGAMPVSLLVFIAFSHSVIRAILGYPVKDALIDFATGAGAALLICWPMLLVTLFCWRAKNRLNLHVSVLKTVHLVIWPVCFLFGYRGLRPPCWVTQPGCLPPGIGRNAYEFFNKIAYLGLLICAWYDPKC
jgi:hypothetical protein